MLHIGEYNLLSIKDKEARGYQLDGGEDGLVFLPHSKLKEDIARDCSAINVFVYRDSKQRLVGTQEQPLAQVGQVSFLKVLETNKIGAFLDWGLDKDLLVPFHEQVQPMEAGKSYLVMPFLDANKRIAASSKLDEFLHDENESTFEKNQQVDIVIANKTELGFKAVVNNTHWGLLFDNEIFQPLRRGKKLSAYIKTVREDDRLDLIIQKPGFDKSRVEGLSALIIEEINKQGGFLAMNDKSSPADISARFHVSKKQFKQALGKLYKQRLIEFKDDGVQCTIGN